MKLIWINAGFEMQRSIDATLSRINISENKTIYVEGNLDQALIHDLLISIGINNVSVIQIKDNEAFDVTLGSKFGLIELVKKANADNTISNSYLGVVDKDYCPYMGTLLEIENLIYTDYNSMESYLADMDVLNRLLVDYSCEEMTDECFSKYQKNFLYFSLLFFFQSIENEALSNDEKICFKELNICNNRYLRQNNRTIKVKCIINDKVINSRSTKSKFISFARNVDTGQLFSNKKCFNHGKYLLNYIICNLKQKNRSINYYTNEAIVNSLKDKFILLRKYQNYNLFNNILAFCQ